MTTTVGSKLYELTLDSKAEELIKLMESTSPELLAQVSKKDAAEALVDALSFLENDTTASPLSLEIVRRAKKLVLSRSTILN